MPMEVHEGEVALTHAFGEVHGWLRRNGERALATAAGAPFVARAATANRRNDVTEAVIKFYRDGREYGRVYACCWGRYYNCYRTRVGMYCQALDAAVV